MRRHATAALLTGLVVLLACAPLMIVGAQVGHDHEVQLVRARLFSEQLAGGEFYPRWLLDINEGAGGPTFFLYPPFAFHVASAGTLLAPGAPATVQLAVGESLLVLLSGLAFLWFARPLAGPWAAAACSVLYALGPYHFGVDLLERQAIAEVANFVAFPLVFGCLVRMARGRGSTAAYAGAYALMVMAHLPTALLASGMLVPWFAALRPPRRAWARFAAGTVLGVLLSGVYLVPALASTAWVSLDGMWDGRFSYDRWFLLDGVAAPDAGFEETLRGVALVLTVGAAGALPSLRRPLRGPGCAFLAIVPAAWFLMTPMSRPLFEHLPFLDRVQFPWRVLALLEFGVIAALAPALRGAPGRAGFALIAAGALVVGGRNLAHHVAASGDAAHEAELRRALESPRDQRDFRPRGARLPDAGQPRVAGPATVVSWRPRTIILEVDPARPSDLVVRQFRYPGWRAVAEPGNRPLPDPGRTTGGLLRIAVPAGTERVRLELRPTGPEIAGWLLSGLGLVAVIALRWRRRAKNLAAPVPAVHSPASTGPDPERPASLPPGRR